MRLIDWRADAPGPRSLGPDVVAVVQPVLQALCDDSDPDVWIDWGDDPGARYVVLALATAGLVSCDVRVDVAADAPRASARLVRWARVETGELAMENQGGRRLVSFQVEGHALRGADDIAARLASFALALFAAMDARLPPNAAPTTTTPVDVVPDSIQLPGPRDPASA